MWVNIQYSFLLILFKFYSKQRHVGIMIYQALAMFGPNSLW